MITASRWHGHYWLLPVGTAFVWTGMLLGLLLWWVVEDDHTRYEIDQGAVLYISNVGAEHQWLFIVGCVLTAVGFTVTLLAERWLRHLRRIPGALRKRERNCDISSVVFGIAGVIALILVSCFNDITFPNIHWSCAAIFIVCIVISAACNTAEVMWIERSHVDRKHLRRSAIIKLIIIVVAFCAAIAFAACYGACASRPKTAAPQGRCNVIVSTAAALEWFIAFMFDLYVLSYVIDLLPARQTLGHHFHPSLIEADKNNELKASKNPNYPQMTATAQRNDFSDGDSHETAVNPNGTTSVVGDPLHSNYQKQPYMSQV